MVPLILGMGQGWHGWHSRGGRRSGSWKFIKISWIHCWELGIEAGDGWQLIQSGNAARRIHRQGWWHWQSLGGGTGSRGCFWGWILGSWLPELPLSLLDILVFLPSRGLSPELPRLELRWISPWVHGAGRIPHGKHHYCINPKTAFQLRTPLLHHK